MKLFILLSAVLTVANLNLSAEDPGEGINHPVIVDRPATKSSLNFFVISKRKKGKLDLATRFNVLRTKLRSLFRKKNFVSIIAENSQDMSNQVREHLEKKDSQIGTIWFDSHGMYKKGYSLFFIGEDEVSYKTLKCQTVTSAFEKLSAYSNDDTRIIIGSCYGGATYTRPSIDYKDTTRMNGDSLMISLGKLFSSGAVFACESWVMSKPGLFWRRPAAGGNPGRRLFEDKCYEPAWKNIGVWNQYSIANDCIVPSNTVAMDKNGNLVVRAKPYVIEKNAQKDINKKLKDLKPGLYK